VAALSRFGTAIDTLWWQACSRISFSNAFDCGVITAHRMTPAELKQRMEAGDPLVVVDLRADAERLEGCIPGALPVAFRDLDALLPEP